MAGFTNCIRERLGRIRISLRLHKWPAWVGRLSLLYNRLLNPGLRVGKGARVRGRFCVIMHGEGEIVFGAEAHIISDYKRSTLGVWARSKFVAFPGARIIVGDHVLMAGTTIVARKSVEIGEETLVSPNVFIVDSHFHNAWPPEGRSDMSPIEEAEPVKIGRRVWIGLNAIILKGVTIGDNAVIGAGSVVTGDIPANTLAAGSPARVIRRLDEPAGADAGAAPAAGRPPSRGPRP
jgi:acetyltransferase-like isoleucine patch superfamily enzyme